MECKRFGSTGLQVSEITLGSWVFGHGQGVWREADDEESYQVMQQAVAKGINHVATAGYGNAETVVGNGLKGMRDKVYFATSTGSRARTPEEGEQKLDGALKALQIDYLDFYYIHYPHKGFLKSIENMNAVREKGKVKHLGASNFSQPQLAKAREVAPVEFIQSPHNLLWREIEEDMLPFCRENDVAVTTYSSIAQGVLAGKYRSYDDIQACGSEIVRNNQYCQEEAFPRVLEVLKLLDELAAKYDKTLAQIASRWLLDQEGVTSVILGIRTVAQLEDNLGAVGWKLDTADWRRLSDKGKDVSEAMNYSKNMWDDVEYYRGLE